MTRRVSIRFRLTLWWGGLFFVFGLMLLGVHHAVTVTAVGGIFEALQDDAVGVLVDEDGSSAPLMPGGGPLLEAESADVIDRGRSEFMHRVRRASFTALASLAAAAAAVGWFVAGRMLAPIRTITEAARQITDADLSHRIAARGPRDELRELADAFDEMLARLERAFEAQHAFIADASHEFRTPLTLIRVELDVTLTDPDASQQELDDATDSIRQALDHTEQLIDRLLQLASAEVIHDRHPVELRDLVRASVDAHLPSDASLRVELNLQPAEAFGDTTLLNRLVDNLVYNAVRHNLPDGWITASTHSEETQVHLAVANSGPVLADDELARLTGRFYRPDPSRARETGGSGLGLAIVATIVRAHGGTLELTAVAGGGLEVDIALPANPSV